MVLLLLRPLGQIQKPIPASGEEEDIALAEAVVWLYIFHHLGAVGDGDDI